MKKKVFLTKLISNITNISLFFHQAWGWNTLLTASGHTHTPTGLTMVELEASSPAQTSVPPPSGLLNTAFLVSSLQDEPALNVCTGEQEQLGSWLESCWGVLFRAMRTQRRDGLERPAGETGRFIQETHSTDRNTQIIKILVEIIVSCIQGVWFSPGL